MIELMKFGWKIEEIGAVFDYLLVVPWLKWCILSRYMHLSWSLNYSFVKLFSCHRGDRVVSDAGMAQSKEKSLLMISYVIDMIREALDKVITNIIPVLGYDKYFERCWLYEENVR